MRLILQEDDCAPDARECFEKEFKKLTGMGTHHFIRIANRKTTEDDGVIYSLLGFELHFSPSDPFYSLYSDHELSGLARRENSHVTHEPMPSNHSGEVVLDRVIADLKEKAEFGKKKYGTLLRTNNGRNALVDAYQEALDLAMYLKQRIMEDELV